MVVKFFIVSFLIVGRHADLILCGTTTVRLVSSGEFDNFATVYIRQMGEDDTAGYMNVLCPVELTK